MTLLEICTQFKTVTDAIAGLNGFSFGWPSDRTRSQIYTAPGEDQTDLYPRVFFAVPTITHNPTSRNDGYQVEVYFDDLLGYDDTGETDTDTQVEKWSTLITYAEQWIYAMQAYKTTGVITGEVNMVLDSFVSSQRLITVQCTFTFSTKASC